MYFKFHGGVCSTIHIQVCEEGKSGNIVSLHDHEVGNCQFAIIQHPVAVGVHPESASGSGLKAKFYQRVIFNIGMREVR